MQEACVKEVGHIISPENITFASKVLYSQFCIFLSSGVLDLLLNKKHLIKLKGQEIQIRRLIKTYNYFKRLPHHPTSKHYHCSKKIQHSNIQDQ